MKIIPASKFVNVMELIDEFITKLYMVEPHDCPRILYRMLDISDDMIKNDKRIESSGKEFSRWIQQIIERQPFPFPHPKTEPIFKYNQKMTYSEFKYGMETHIYVKSILSPAGKKVANGISQIKLFSTLLSQINHEMDAEMEERLKPCLKDQSVQTDDFPPISKEEHERAFAYAFDHIVWEKEPNLLDEQKEPELKISKNITKEILSMKKDMKEMMHMIHALYKF